MLLHAPAGLTAKRLLIVGLGKLAKATVHSVRDAAGTAVRFAKPRGDSGCNAGVAGKFREGLGGRAGEGCRGGRRMLATSTRTPIAATGRTRAFRPFTLAVAGTLAVRGEAERGAIEAAFAEGAIIGESQNFARALVNEPGNKLTPTILGQRAAEMAQEVGLGWDVHSTEKLHELKMGSVLERIAGIA
ncbi:MAG: M17 family peptidase N-terminal domain-containing protein [Terracidiphilus sp.]